VQLPRVSTDGSPKRANFWYSVLQAGLPIIFIYHLIDYLVSRATTGARFRYPSWFEVMSDVVVVLVVSTLHWKGKSRRA
jgi:hypothetical protein